MASTRREHGQGRAQSPGRGTARVAVALGAAAVALLAGCASTPHYKVESRFVAAQRADAAPEVYASPAYADLLPNLRRVALRAPSWCEVRTAAEVGGTAAGQGRILQNECAVQMSRIERAFVRKGFSVISWDVIRNAVTNEVLTPRRAAENEGAQVLFHVNSLERAQVDPGSDARLERRFYHSSPRRETGPPAEVSVQRAGELERFVVPEEERLLTRGPRHAATLNAQAVHVPTGQTLWFYEWTHAEPAGTRDRVEVVVRCPGDAPCQRLPAPAPTPAPGPRTVTGSTRAVSTTPVAMDRSEEIYDRLVEEAILDMVSRFAAGS